MLDDHHWRIRDDIRANRLEDDICVSLLEIGDAASSNFMVANL